MRRTVIKPALLCILAVMASGCGQKPVISPNGRINVSVDGQELAVSFGGSAVFEKIHLGLVTKDADLNTSMTLKRVSGARKVVDDYQMVSGKRSKCHNEAQERRLHYVSPEEERLCVIVRAYDDGVALRYVTEVGSVVTDDMTSYLIKDGARRWISPLKTDYESFFPMATDGSASQERTWPNMMSMESVYGAEWYNNGPLLTARAAAHNATLPFTRNVIGPMDYTPGTFSDSQFPHITTNAHELALPVLFESGLQHMPDRPSAYDELPAEARKMLGGLPSAWDETRLLAGYPGESAVIARRSGPRWYVAAVNGLDEPAELPLPLDKLGLGSASFTLFSDAEPATDIPVLGTIIDAIKQADREIVVSQMTAPGGAISVPCRARGGYVAVITCN